MATVKGIFTSVWDGGQKIETEGTLNSETGEVCAESVDVDVDILEEEYFTDENGNVHNVCPECHEYITKVVIVESIGKQLTDFTVCTNPDCDNMENIIGVKFLKKLTKILK